MNGYQDNYDLGSCAFIDTHYVIIFQTLITWSVFVYLLKMKIPNYLSAWANA